MAADEYQDLNKQVEFSCKANCALNMFNTKAGNIAVGEGGLEFIANMGAGFVQIPWSEMEHVRVDIVGKKHVRALEVMTKQGTRISFIPTYGAELLRAMSKHLSRDTFMGAQDARSHSFMTSIRSRFSRHK